MGAPNFKDGPAGRDKGLAATCGTRQAVLTVVGFALFLALGSTSAWGLITLVSMSWLGLDDVVEYETMHSAGFLTTLFVFGFGCLRQPGAFAVNTAAASTALWTAGYAGFFAVVCAGPEWSALIGVSSICLGAAHALSFIVWQRVFFSENDLSARRQIVLGSALSSIVYLLLSLIGNVGVYMASIVALIAANALALKRCAAGAFERSGRRGPLPAAAGGQVRNLVSGSWRYALCIAAIGYVSGVSRALSRSSGGDALTLNVMLAAGMLLACALLMLLWDGLRVSFSFRAAYTGMFLFMATAFIAVPFFGSGYRTVLAGLANLAFTLASMLMMITCLRLARLRGLDPVGVFGLFAGTVYSGVLVGRLVGLVFGDASEVSQALLLALLTVYLLSFSGAVATMARSAREGGFDPVRDGGGDPPAQPGDAGVGPAPTAGEAGGKRRQLAKKPADEARGPGGPGARGVQTVRPAASPEPEGQGLRMVERVVVLRDSVPACCEALRQRFGLTRRETDVLELIARGRDVAHIAEALFVSENTVRSHCKSLYRKIGAHSRQDVFDLLEGCQEEMRADPARKGGV